MSDLIVPVLFEDRDLLIVNKPSNLNVHATPARPDEENLESVVKERFGQSHVLLHRLDRDTTGVVIFAKRRDVAGEMSRAFEEKRIRKSYMAVVEGAWPRQINKVDEPIPAGSGFDMKKALTTFRVLSGNKERTWVEAIPKTGRKHQIRLHCLKTGHAICGDRLYHPDREHFLDSTPSLALHAYRVDFRHPMTGGEIKIRVAPPETWNETWLSSLKFEDVLERLCPKIKSSQ